MIPLYVDLEREWRGGQSQAWFTLRGLRDLGHKAELVAARNSPLTQRTAAEGIVVHMVPRLGLRLWAARAIRHLLSSNKFDLVHVNEAHALTSAWMAGSHRRLPLLISRRIGFPLKRTKVSRARYNAVTFFIANCREVAQSLVQSGIAERRIMIVNEGVEVPPLASADMCNLARQHWGVHEQEFLLGCVGYLLPEKGQRFLIEALARVRQEFPNVRLLLAGDDPCRLDLERLAKETGQKDSVSFAGFVEDVSRVYAALDVFLFPSLFEGLGTSLQAAMAWGAAGSHNGPRRSGRSGRKREVWPGGGTRRQRVRRSNLALASRPEPSHPAWRRRSRKDHGEVHRCENGGQHIARL